MASEKCALYYEEITSTVCEQTLTHATYVILISYVLITEYCFVSKDGNTYIHHPSNQNIVYTV